MKKSFDISTIERAIAGDLEARNEVVVAYLPLGMTIAKDLGWWETYSKDEIRSTVALALIKALETYDPTKGKWVSHASVRIRKELKREWLKEQGYKSNKGYYDTKPPQVTGLQAFVDAEGQQYEPKIEATYSGLQRRPKSHCACGTLLEGGKGAKGSVHLGLCSRCYTRYRRNGLCRCGAAYYRRKGANYCKKCED